MKASSAEELKNPLCLIERTAGCEKTDSQRPDGRHCLSHTKYPIFAVPSVSVTRSWLSIDIETNELLLSQISLTRQFLLAASEIITPRVVKIRPILEILMCHLCEILFPGVFS